MSMTQDEKRARLLIALSLVVIIIGFILFFFKFTDNIDSQFVFAVESDGYATVQGYTGNAKTLTIPSQTQEGVPVKYIDHHAFGGHQSDLEKVVIPEGVEVIEEYAFANSPKLKTVVLPSTLKEIGRGAFQNCAYLENIELPDGLLKLDAEVFDSCARLEALKIPASVEEIGVDCFISCESLRLDVSENALAAEMAERYMIETGKVSIFSVYFWVGFLTSLIAVVGVFYLGYYIKKKRAVETKK